MELFRKEALEAVGDTRGRPFGMRDYSTSKIVALFCSLVAAAIIFVSTATFSRKELALGAIGLTTGTPVVVSPTAGVVDNVLARDGAVVQAGTVLVTIRREQKDAAGSNATATINALQIKEKSAMRRNLVAERQQVSMKRRDLTDSLSILQQRQAQERESLDLRRRRLALAKENYANLEVLARDQLVSRLELSKNETTVLDAEEAVVQGQKQLAALRSEESDALAELRALTPELSSVQARIDAHDAQSEANRETSNSDAYFSVVAPVAGTITALTRRKGETVSSGMALAIVVPVDAQMYAELKVPSRAIGFASAGTPVRVMVDAFPYQKFGFARGEITEVALAPLPVSGQDPKEEPYYSVKVKLERTTMPAYGRQWRLVPGMTVQADVILEERTFLEWLFDPVRATLLRM